jgi:hypothetical protein
MIACLGKRIWLKTTINYESENEICPERLFEGKTAVLMLRTPRIQPPLTSTNF